MTNPKLIALLEAVMHPATALRVAQDIDAQSSAHTKDLANMIVEEVKYSAALKRSRDSAHATINGMKRKTVRQRVEVMRLTEEVIKLRKLKNVTTTEHQFLTSEQSARNYREAVERRLLQAKARAYDTAAELTNALIEESEGEAKQRHIAQLKEKLSHAEANVAYINSL